MIKKKFMSQCITSDYCQGWNDAVDSIVRCKDCKHSKYKRIIGKAEEGEQTSLLHCTMFIREQHVYEDDFCSYGERAGENNG